MKKVIGSILMAVGILIAGASGLCSLAFLGMGAAEGLDGFVMASVFALLYGSIPFGIGLGAFFGGRALVRQAKSEAAKENARKTPEPREVQSRSDVSR